MIDIKTKSAIERMRQGGGKLRAILRELIDMARPGVTPLEMEYVAQKLIRKTGGTPSFQTVSNYQFATCISINDAVVHGIPTSKPFVSGDIVGVDVGLLYEGFHTDTSWSVLVGNPDAYPEKKQFLAVGEQALKNALNVVKPGNCVGDISQAIQTTIESKGYSVMHELVGHGVGRVLHEDPEIPGFLRKKKEKTPLLKAGMALAVEVIYAEGKRKIYIDRDGWTIRTKDGTLAGLFETTVIVTHHGSVVLT